MIEIYKKLPKTNCGKCGEITCTSFALKVINAQRVIGDCPFMIPEKNETNSGKRVITAEDNYSRVSKELEKEAKTANFKTISVNIGGDYRTINGRESIRLKMLNKFYEMRREGLFEDDTYCNDSWSKIILYDYIRRNGNRPLTGEWVTLGYFPNTASHVKAFQRSAEDKVSLKFNKNIQALKCRTKEFGGIPAQGKIKADYIFSFALLPKIPLYVCFWDADEEFPANCKLFFDSSAEDYIDIEYLAYLVERFVELLTR